MVGMTYFIVLHGVLYYEESYINFFKVRMKERGGLMRARMQGIEAASAEVRHERNVKNRFLEWKG